MNIGLIIGIAIVIGVGILTILDFRRERKAKSSFTDKPFEKTDEIYGDVPKVDKEYYRGRKL